MEAEKIAQFRSAEPRGNKDPDDGEWFRMAHVLFRAIYSSKELDKAQIKLLLFCIHSTWGQMGRASFIFSLKAAVKATGMDKSQVCRARDTLIKGHVLIKVDRDGIELKVNKYPDKWDLDIVKGVRDADTERRRKNVDGSTTRETVDGSTTKTLTDPQRVVDGSTTLTELNEALSLDHGDPIDNTLIDKGVDNPLYPPTGDRVCYPSDYRFDEFWAAYPRKTARKKAAEKWASLTKRKDFGDDLVDRMLGAIRTHKQTDQWKRKVIPHPATWLNQDRWDDEIETAAPSNPFDLSRLTGE